MSLFMPLTIKGITFRNRIVVSPMCQYSCKDGLANEWHLVHLGSRAVGGAAAIIVEATAVSPEGRITPDDMGIWSDAHAEALRPITRFILSQGAVPGIQLAHAGRKASTYSPWKGDGPLKGGNGAWPTLGPSALPIQTDWPAPQAMTIRDIKETITEFQKAARRAFATGFEILELHSAHGYLLHQFLSPLSKHREDSYGGDLANRMRFPLQVAGAVRKVWPENLPLIVRISCTDWMEGGWTPEESVEYSKQLKGLGVDLVDCSSGGLVPNAKVPVGPVYQVPFSEKIRKEAGIPTMAVGMITEPARGGCHHPGGQGRSAGLGQGFLKRPLLGPARGPNPGTGRSLARPIPEGQAFEAPITEDRMTPSTHKPPVFYLHRAQATREKLLNRMDPRTLHDFRTSLRRIEAALRLDKPLLGKRRFALEIEQIKYLQGLTSPLREADVTAEILRSIGLSPENATAQQSARRREMVEAFQSILADKIFDRSFSGIAKALQEMEREEKRARLQKKIKASFLKEMDGIRKTLEAYNHKGPKRKVLHHLRIRAKRLRYDLELFDFLRPAKRKKVLQAANDAQNSLGKLRDWQGAEKSLKGARTVQQGKNIEVLEYQEKKLLRQARKAIRQLNRTVT